MQLAAFEFRVSSYVTDEADTTLVIEGNQLILPTEHRNYYQVYRTAGDYTPDEFVFAVPAHAVHAVRSLTADELEAHQAKQQEKASESSQLLAVALEHLGRLVAPWRKLACSFVDPDLVADGAPTCMNHSRVGSKPGTCGVAEAIEFLYKQQQP